MRATRIFVHCDVIYLLDLHVKKVLPGNPIPAQYTVHSTEIDTKNHSLNLVMTNGGGPIDTELLAEHLRRLHIFGSKIQVGVFGDDITLAD